MQEILFNKVHSQNTSPGKVSSLKNSISSARFQTPKVNRTVQNFNTVQLPSQEVEAVKRLGKPRIIQQGPNTSKKEKIIKTEGQVKSNEKKSITVNILNDEIGQKIKRKTTNYQKTLKSKQISPSISNQESSAAELLNEIQEKLREIAQKEQELQLMKLELRQNDEQIVAESDSNSTSSILDNLLKVSELNQKRYNTEQNQNDSSISFQVDMFDERQQKAELEQLRNSKNDNHQTQDKQLQQNDNDPVQLSTHVQDSRFKSIPLHLVQNSTTTHPSLTQRILPDNQIESIQIGESGDIYHPISARDHKLDIQKSQKTSPSYVSTQFHPTSGFLIDSVSSGQSPSQHVSPKCLNDTQRMELTVKLIENYKILSQYFIQKQTTFS